MKGDPLEKKNSKKSHNAEKLKRGTLWRFSTSILSQKIKNLKGKNFYIRKEFSQCRKKLKRGPFGIFQHAFLRKTSKTLKGDPLGETLPKQKSRSAEKKLNGPFGLGRYGMLREKTGKTILAQFARPNGAI